MSNSRIHIDHLFAKGLENLEIPLVHNAFEQIRKDIPAETAGPTPFSNFEIAVTDADWLAIKEKLALVQAQETAQPIENSLKELELAVSDNDWQIIKDRLARKDNTLIIPLPADDLGSSLKDFEIAVTDADWKATEAKLNDYRKKKMIWWWWLNIAVIGSLIGLALSYYAPLSSASIIKSNVVAEERKTEAPVIHKDIVPEQASTPENTPTSAEEKHTVTGNDPAPGKNTASLNTPSASGNNKTNRTAEPTRTSESASEKNNDRLTEDPYKGISGQTENTSHAVNDQTLKNDAVKSGLSDIIKNTVTEPMPLKPAEQTDQIVTGDDKEVKADLQAVAVNPTDTPKKTQPVTPPTPPPFPGGGLHFYAGLATDVAMTYRKLDKTNDEYYNKIRNNAERPTLQISYGFTAGIIKGKDQLQTGVQYTTQNFVSNYNYSYPIYDSIPLYGPPPTYVFKGYFLFKKRDTTMHSEEKITLKKIEVPFNYSRTWNINSKTQLITGVSSIMSFNTKATGSLALNPVNNQLYFYRFQKKAEQQFGFSPGINLGVQRQIAPRILLQGNAFGRYTLTNRYENSYGVKENLYSYGVSFKLLYLIK